MAEQQDEREGGPDTDSSLRPMAVVTVFLRYRDRILLVRRSHRVGSYRGRWSGISGYLEAKPPLVQAQTEITEETTLPADEVHLVASGEAFAVPAPELSRLWIVHPFLFDIDNPDHVRLDWENIECRWVAPGEIEDYPTVPKLAEAFQACLRNRR